MWKVEFTDKDGRRVFHTEEFHTRKAARLWCKRTMKPEMVLHGPNGEKEFFQKGVTCAS